MLDRPPTDRSPDDLRPDPEAVLDAAAHLVVNDGFDAVSISQIATRLGVDPARVTAAFGTLDELLVSMLNREYAAIFRVIVDHVERDPMGGLLSHVYRYTLSAVYERPLAKALYLADRDGLNTIMRATHGFIYLPGAAIRSEFIDAMKSAGMVRHDVDSAKLSALISAVSAGTALTAPHTSGLDDISEGLSMLLARGVDTDVADTGPGKAALVDYVAYLAAPPDRG